MIEKPYLVHWSDDSDRNTEAVATLDEAQTEIDRWLDLRRREADDGWALDMTGCIAVIVERVVEEESEAPEWSSFDRHVDYHREKVPDLRDARIAALEGENAALKASAEANADAVSEHAAISALMAADPVLCRYGVLEAFQMLKARADEACGEPAPLRLGRGPTVEESDAHGDGRWIVWLNIVAGSETCQDGGEFICEVPADFVVRYRSQIRDCIPLSSSRQPCRVGVKV